MERILARSKKTLSVLLSCGLLLSTFSPAWAVSLGRAPVPRGPGALEIGRAGISYTGVLPVQELSQPLSAQGGRILSSALPTPDAVPGNDGVQLQPGDVSLPPAEMLRQANPSVGQALERHPVIEILNSVQRAGVQLPASLSTPQDFAQLRDAARSLPEGRARESLLSFAETMAGSAGADSAEAAGGALAELFDTKTKNTIPAVEAPKAAGMWASLAESRLAPARLRKYAAKKAEAGRRKAQTIDTDDLLVPPELLRWVPDPEAIPESTREMQPSQRRIFAQDRALESLDFGLRMKGRSYNVIVSGEDGTGGMSAVRYLLEGIAPILETPQDILAVTNLEDKKNPLFLQLPAGEGAKLVEAFKATLTTFRMRLNQVLGSPEFAEALRGLMGGVQQEAAKARTEFLAEVSAAKIKEHFGVVFEEKELDDGRISYKFRLALDGEVLNPDDIDGLVEGLTKEEVIEEFTQVVQGLTQKYVEMQQKNSQMRMQAEARVQKLEKDSVAGLVQRVAAPLLQAALGAADHDNEAHKKFRERSEKRVEELQTRYGKKRIGPFDIQLMAMPMGGQVMIGVGIVLAGKEVTSENGKELEVETQRKIDELKKSGEWQALDEQIQAAAQAYEEAQAGVARTNQEEHQALHANDPPPSPEREKVAQWAQSIVADIAEHYQAFLPAESSGNPMMDMLQGSQRDNPEDRYKVQVLVDNAAVVGAPVVYEKSPTFENLFGYAEDNQQMMMMPGAGMARRDTPGGPTLKAGSLLRANGGYLVLDLLDVLREPGVFQTLMRAVRTGKAQISEKGMMSIVWNQGERYEVPINVKVVFRASPMMKMMLMHYDEDFGRYFKAVAEFESAINISAQAIAAYLNFVKSMVEKKAGGVIDFANGAISGVLEEAKRNADDGYKLSARFGPLNDSMREATYWARERLNAFAGERAEKSGTTVAAELKKIEEEGAFQVEREDHTKALTESDEREGSIKRRIKDYYGRNLNRLVIAGKAKDQLTGLAVIMVGRGFGIPNRISFTTSADLKGAGLIISTERNIKAAGPSFQASLEVLEGFWERTFGQLKGIPLKIRIRFEQNSNGIDGDSATQTMAYGSLLSAAGIEIKQGIPITGSMDQFGNVQPIGGVNEKIEGFYDILVEKLKREGKELAGEQGIIIPAVNVPTLALRPDIVQAVRDGKFKIWGVSHISQGIEILSGMAYSEVLIKINERIDAVRTEALKGAGKE